MTNPFDPKQFKSPSLFQKIFKKEPKENAVVAINNLIASHGIQNITPQDIQKVAQQYRLDINKDISSSVADLYKDYYKHCLVDNFLNDDEIKDLSHLKNIFGITENKIKEIHNKVGADLFAKEVELALVDNRVGKSEMDRLDQFIDMLNLDVDIAKNIYTEKASRILQNYLESLVSDGRYSPEEEEKLKTLASDLQINIDIDDQTKEMLSKLRLYWQIENGELPETKVNINLQKGEKCYFSCWIDWLENRRVTKRINYSGPTARVKIVKGVYWRMGSLGVQSVSDDVLTYIDSGKIYLTNKRLIFEGTKKNNTIQLRKIINFNPFKNGVEIGKETGKVPFLKFSKDIDIFSSILDRLLRELI